MRGAVDVVSAAAFTCPVEICFQQSAWIAGARGGAVGLKHQQQQEKELP
jgi:hypothetical protein